jgi:IclR family transcriptional regulator, KDG regulon repressor
MTEAIMPLKKHPKYHVPAAAKTLQILEALAAFERPVTLQELTEHTGLPKSSIHSILATLETLRYIEREAANTFRLGPKAVQIGAAAQRTTNLSQLFHQTARKIVEECGETVQLTILDQAEVIYVAREDGTQPVQLASNIGGRLPAYATASGRVLLAALPDNSIDVLFARRPFPTLTARTIGSLNQLKPELSLVRERGYAHDNQETSEGLECVAAPIFDRTGQVVAGISVSFLSVRASPEHFQRILGLVQRGAQAISEQMGGRVPAAKNKPGSPPDPSTNGVSDRSP